MQLASLRLKKDQDRRLRFGHCWIYSNEVDTQATPLQGLEAGQPAEFLNHQGKWIGSGYLNPHSLICGRLVSRDREHRLSGSLIVHRLKIALALRKRLYPLPYYRLVFGESDGLPGLVIDRYGDLLVLQITTAGMERLLEEIVRAVEKVLRPVGVILRNDTEVRKAEGLESRVEMISGVLPDALEVEEGGLRFRIPATSGQKTGWFFDQAFNRERMRRYLPAERVLDVCSYLGSWALQAAVQGAEQVLCVDVSRPALEGLQENAALNGMTERISVLPGDAFDILKGLCEERERFDLVLLDPPAFIKRRKDMKQGTLAYRRLNQLALRLLSKDGVLITSSCSYHLPAANFLQLLQQAGRHLDRSLQLLEQGAQSPDHPIHPAMPETAYLKTFYLRALPVF